MIKTQLGVHEIEAREKLVHAAGEIASRSRMNRGDDWPGGDIIGQFVCVLPAGIPAEA